MRSKIRNCESPSLSCGEMRSAETAGAPFHIVGLESGSLSVSGQPLTDGQTPLPHHLVLLHYQAHSLGAARQPDAGVHVLKVTLVVNNVAQLGEQLLILLVHFPFQCCLLLLKH